LFDKIGEGKREKQAAKCDLAVRNAARGPKINEQKQPLAMGDVGNSVLDKHKRLRWTNLWEGEREEGPKETGKSRISFSYVSLETEKSAFRSEWKTLVEDQKGGASTYRQTKGE